MWIFVSMYLEIHHISFHYYGINGRIELINCAIVLCVFFKHEIEWKYFMVIVVRLCFWFEIITFLSSRKRKNNCFHCLVFCLLDVVLNGLSHFVQEYNSKELLWNRLYDIWTYFSFLFIHFVFENRKSIENSVTNENK